MYTWYKLQIHFWWLLVLHDASFVSVLNSQNCYYRERALRSHVIIIDKSVLIYFRYLVNKIPGPQIVRILETID